MTASSGNQPPPIGSGRARVSCAFHDELELRALRRRPCRLVFLDDAGCAVSIDTLVTDLIAQQGREFALLADGQRIPLERIISVDGIRP